MRISEAEGIQTYLQRAPYSEGLFLTVQGWARLHIEHTVLIYTQNNNKQNSTRGSTC